MARILHILNRIAGDGPTRTLIALVKFQVQLGLPHTQRVVALERAAYPVALLEAHSVGLSIKRTPTDEQLRQEIEEADIVHLHFWNNPNIYRVLRMAWPDARLLVRFCISGLYAPQSITPSVVALADCCVGAVEATLTDTPVADAACKRHIFSMSDFTRLADLAPQPHEGFNVGYIGTVNFGKLHPEFVPMSTSVEVPDVRFIVCGTVDEAVQAQIAESGAAERFEVRGYVEDIGSVLAQCDLFGYPLQPENYATSDKALQEAMYAGVPPVVFDHPNLRGLVEHGKTGWIVDSPQAYSRAIAYLHQNPALRKRLGTNARAFAQKAFAPQRTAEKFGALYEEMLTLPKTPHTWQGVPRTATAAKRFIDTLGPDTPPLALSMNAKTRADHVSADEAIMHFPTRMTGGEGGLFQYRNAYPEDGWLRYWAGLVLFGQQRYAKAKDEMQAATALGIPTDRIQPYLR